MKEGEKITINLKVKTKGQTKVSPASNNTPKNSGFGDGGLLLPPPPSGGQHKPVSRAAPQQQRVAPQPVAQQAKKSGGLDDFADILAPSKPAPAPVQAKPQQQQPKPQQGASALDDFLL